MSASARILLSDTWKASPLVPTLALGLIHQFFLGVRTSCCCLKICSVTGLSWCFRGPAPEASPPACQPGPLAPNGQCSASAPGSSVFLGLGDDDELVDLRLGQRTLAVCPARLRSFSQPPLSCWKVLETKNLSVGIWTQNLNVTNKHSEFFARLKFPGRDLRLQ